MQQTFFLRKPLTKVVSHGLFTIQERKSLAKRAARTVVVTRVKRFCDAEPQWTRPPPLITTVGAASFAKLFRFCIENKRYFTTSVDSFRRKNVCCIAWSSQIFFQNRISRKLRVMTRNGLWICFQCKRIYKKRLMNVTDQNGCRTVLYSTLRGINIHPVYSFRVSSRR